MTLDWDAYGEALLDYHHNRYIPPLLLNTSYGVQEKMPAEIFFREEEDFSSLEEYALSLVSGHVLDVGAGAGPFSLWLQDQGYDVTALEISSQACQVMEARGIRNVVNKSVYELNGSEFDTILLMMNGLGLFETLNGLRRGLSFLKDQLAPGGQIIADSSDIRYLYESALPEKHYFGEINYQYIYHRRPGPWFKWIYIDQKTLAYEASKAGLTCQVVFEGEKDHYLVLLKNKSA